jgi:hypothetical protein
MPKFQRALARVEEAPITEPPASETRRVEPALGASGLPCLAEPADELTNGSASLAAGGTKQYDFGIPGTPPARPPAIRPRAPDLFRSTAPETAVEVKIEDE